MTAKVKLKLTIPVVVEIETDWDRRARQAVVVGGEATQEIPITARLIYEHINPKEFHGLDSRTWDALDAQFRETVEPYREKPDGLPPGEVRGVAASPKYWADTMKWLYGSYLRMPVPLVLEVLKKLEKDVVLEPVLSTVPTVYIWNVNPANDVLDKIAARAEFMKSPQTIRMEDGSLQLRWTR